MRTGHAGKSPTLGGCDTAGEAIRNHLPVDAQVPAGLGTAMGRAFRKTCTPSSCPGVFGPVPQPVSMDGQRLPAEFRLVNRFIGMKR